MSFDFKLTGGSFVLGEAGDIEITQHNEKLAQDIIKIIATSVGQSKLHPWYGTVINERIIGSGVSSGLLKAQVEESIQFALQNLKSIQEQAERAGQLLSPREAISAIENVTVLDTTDPRQLLIRISVRTRSGSKLQQDLPLNI